MKFSINETVIQSGFCDVDTGEDGGMGTSLGLIEQSVVVHPAEVKTDYVDVPGTDGRVDATEAFGRVCFGNRVIEATYALKPGAAWHAKQTSVSNALNGKRMYIKLTGDTGVYYRGRVTVNGYKRDGMLRQITLSIEADPWKYHMDEVYVSSAALTTTYTELTVQNGGAQYAIPVIAIKQDTTLQYHDRYTGTDKEVTLTHDISGTAFYVVPSSILIRNGIEVSPGTNTFRAKIASGSGGSIYFLFREADL